MTIKEVKQIIKKLNKFSIICYNKVPIKLPEIVNFDGKKISIKEAEKHSYIKNGYLPVGTQCMCSIDMINNSLDKDEIEISFFCFIYCVIKSDEDIFEIWELHKEELNSIGE